MAFRSCATTLAFFPRLAQQLAGLRQVAARMKVSGMLAGRFGKG